MNEVAQFHNLSQIFISFVGATLLMAIYYNIRRRFKQILEDDDSQKRVDKGLLYLSAATFTWVLSGLWAWMSVKYSFELQLKYSIGVGLLSIVNNMFILLALYYFHYAPKFIYHNERNVRIILVIIITVTVTTAASIALSSGYGAERANFGSWPDLLLSAFLSYLLVVSLFQTFRYRGLNLVAIFSVAIVALMLISQLPEVFPFFLDDFTTHLLKLISKAGLISVFLLLATTWVIRLASMPKQNEMQIRFDDWSLVRLTIPSKNIHNELIDFGGKTTQFKNLLKFALKRKFSNGLEQSIEVGAAGEIKNQSYLSRILDNINEALELDKESALERRDLFTFLGEGKYRLRILPDQIVIDPSLKSEFEDKSK